MIALVLDTGRIQVFNVVVWRMNPSIPRIVKCVTGKPVKLECIKIRAALAKGRTGIDVRVCPGQLADEPAIIGTGTGQCGWAGQPACIKVDHQLDILDPGMLGYKSYRAVKPGFLWPGEQQYDRVAKRGTGMQRTRGFQQGGYAAAIISCAGTVRGGVEVLSWPKNPSAQGSAGQPR